MKKMYWISLSYFVFGLTTGLVNHEISYWTDFTGESVMSVVHPHAILLGGLVFLLMPLFMKIFELENQKSFQCFVWTYNIGLVMTLSFMTVRGMSQLFGMTFPGFLDHMVGGLAGIGHVILMVGLSFLFHTLMKSVDKRSE